MYNPKSVSCNVSTASPMAEKLSERLEAMAGSSMFDMEEVCTLLEEAAELARRVEWQPIETAPRGEVEFLSVANYTDEPRQVQIVDWEFVQQCQPGLYTHWMSLPPLPTIDNARVKETEA